MNHNNKHKLNTNNIMDFLNFSVVEETKTRKASTAKRKSRVAPIYLKKVKREKTGAITDVFTISPEYFEKLGLENMGISATIINGEVYFIVLAEDIAQKLKGREGKNKSYNFQYNSIAKHYAETIGYEGSQVNFDMEKVSESGVNAQGIAFESIWKLTVRQEVVANTEDGEGDEDDNEDEVINIVDEKTNNVNSLLDDDDEIDSIS